MHSYWVKTIDRLPPDGEKMVLTTRNSTEIRRGKIRRDTPVPCWELTDCIDPMENHFAPLPGSQWEDWILNDFPLSRKNPWCRFSSTQSGAPGVHGYPWP